MKLLGFLLFFFVCIPAQAIECTERSFTVEVDGEAFNAFLYLPDVSRAVPVVFNLAPSVGLNPLDGVIASDLCRNAIATVLLEVYSQNFMNAVNSLSAVEQKNRFALKAVRLLIDKVSVLPEIDAQRMGMIGSSMGGIFGALYFPTDERLLAFVNILGAENIPAILTYSDNRQVTAFRNRVMAEERMRSPNEFLSMAKRELFLDPARTNNPERRDRILQVMLETDLTVPYENQLALWERSGRPARILFTSGDHTDQYIDFILYNFKTVVDFLKRKLDWPVNTPRGRGIVHRVAP